MRALERNLAELTGLVYDAALEPEYRPEFLQKVVETFDGCNASLGFLPAGNDPPLMSSLTPPELLSAYLNEVHNDPWYRVGLRRGFSGAVLGSELVAPREYRKSHFYRQYNRPCDIEYLAAAGSVVDPTCHSYVTVNRSRQQGDFSRRTAASLDPLSRHIVRAGRLYCRAQAADAAPIVIGAETLPTETASIDATLRHLPHFDFDASGLRCSNKAADQALQNARKRAQLSSVETQVLLRIAETGSTVVVTHSPTGHSKLYLTVSRPTELVQKEFGLTAAEMRVVDSISRGRSPREIAEVRCVSLHTVRTQLKSAMRKMDVHSQRELVASIKRTKGTEFEL